MAFSLLHDNDRLFDVNNQPFAIGHFRVPKTLTFKMGPGAEP